jgi:prepilin-type N-terminal cleavage/methylation domain-containing protein
MIHLRNNERGMSLIEVLLTLTILSIVGTVIWQAFFQGYQYSNNAVSKNLLQQEANLVITNLTRVHQSLEEYTIKSSNGTIELLDSSNSQIAKYTDIRFNYGVFLNAPDTEPLELTNKSVIPSDKGQNLNIKVTIEEKNNSNNNVEVETLLYRLKDGDLNG